MASIGDAARAASIAALGLAVALLWAAPRLPPPETPRSAGESQDGTAAAEAQWEALWSALAEQGEEALAPDIQDRSLQAAGDTIFMRYRNLWSAVDKNDRYRFQMIAMANDPQQKLELLAPLSGAENALIRYRAWLETARVHLRARNLDAARVAAQAALGTALDDPRLHADALFALGFVALEQRDLERAEQSFNQAIARDPGFWDARQLRLLTLSRLLGGSIQSTASCLDRTRIIIEDLGALPALAQSRLQFRDIADRFGALAGGRNPAFDLAAGLGYFWAGDREQAHQSLQRARSAQGELPARCAELIAAKANHLLERNFK